MAFDNIEIVRPAKPSGAPDDGVKVTACKCAGRQGGGLTRYIRLTIGAQLARRISLTQAEHGLRLLFGSGPDAGKLQVSVDNEGGRFRAKRDKARRYVVTINAATARGRFALDFPAFTRSPVEALRPQNGQPPHFVFKASAEMLKADDDR